MNDKTVGLGLFGYAFAVLLAVLGFLIPGMLFPTAAMIGMLTVAGTVLASFAGWKAWLRGERHRLATRIREREADLAHRKAEALLELELDQARHDAGRARATVTRIQDAADQRLITSLDPAPDPDPGPDRDLGPGSGLDLPPVHDRPVDQPVDQSVDRSVDHSVGHGAPAPVEGW